MAADVPGTCVNMIAVCMRVCVRDRACIDSAALRQTITTAIESPIWRQTDSQSSPQPEPSGRDICCKQTHKERREGETDHNIILKLKCVQGVDAVEGEGKCRQMLRQIMK